MARNDKYGKSTPKVSPITLGIVGLFFIALILIIVFSVDTPKQKFTKQYQLQENNYKLASFKNVEKEIKSGKEVIVIFNTKDNETSPIQLLQEFTKAYNKEGLYSNNEVSTYIKVIYYVEIIDGSVLTDFVELHDEIKLNSGFPLALSFSNEVLRVQYEDIKNSGEATEPGKLVVNNTEQFFRLTSEAFKENK